MRIVRFDPEVSIPVTAHGSQFRIGPLTGTDARVQVKVMYLPPAGLIGRHDARIRQLFAVVAGAGWVSGPEGVRRQLRAGYGALWEPGESHEAGSESGLTALCLEGEFTFRGTVVTKDIVITDYNPEWPLWFEQISASVWPAVSDVALRIDHVGSTAVPGLAAKPIIDMDIVVGSQDDIGPVIEGLQTLGYRWRGDLGVAGRQAFSVSENTELPEHHLYVVVENNKAHLDHWLLRDLLLDDPEARERYGMLKRKNLELAEGDMDVYVSAKASLVAELLTRARRERGLPPAVYWLGEGSSLT